MIGAMKKTLVTAAFAIALLLTAAGPQEAGRPQEAAGPQGIVPGPQIRVDVQEADDPAIEEERQGPSWSGRQSATGPMDPQQMLDAHNEWRALYGVPPLKWSPKLARYARQWADFLIRERRFEHHRGSPYGENLVSATNWPLTSDEVVRLWADEGTSYDHATNTCAPGEVCGHFTQVVWKNTREVGCGVSRRGAREVWVCNYNPPGNVVGRRPY